jgi:flagellar hook-length control protein FliK
MPSPAGYGITEVVSPGDDASSRSTGGRLQVPFGEPGWDEALGERVLWHLSRGHARAELRLNPPELGPLEVRIAVHRDEASVHFTTASGPVREALESALPRLRELFAEAGIQLADAGVSSRDPGRRDGRDETGTPRPTAPHDGLPEVDSSRTPSSGLRSARGLVDLFA